MKMILILRFLTFLRFPFEKIADLVLIPLRVLMLAYLYIAILRGGSIRGFTSGEIILWVVFSSVIAMLLPPISSVIESDILSGDIVVKLTRPVSYERYLFIYYSGDFLFYSMIVIVLIFIVNPVPPVRILLLLLFLFMSFTVHFVFELFIGYASVWFGRIWWLKIVAVNVITLFGGGFFPIRWFPGFLYKLINFLPFKFIYAIPLSVIVGKDVQFRMISIEFLIWLFILIQILKIIQKKFRRSFVVYGG